jgi:hypothetical protein
MSLTRNEAIEQQQCPRCRRYYPPGTACAWCPDHPQVEDPDVIAQRDAEAARQAHDAEHAQQALESPATEDPSAPSAPHADEPTAVAPPATPAPAAAEPVAPPAGRSRRER